jgi:hypothetical protein
MVIDELPKLEKIGDCYEEILHHDTYNRLRPEVVSKTRPILRELRKIIVDFDFYSFSVV